ncbi:MAG: J domain-containing protein [Proteobacteria bacterium]|nr:J domain-containing protein [Pseudomonadota bacterium]
MHPYPLAWPDGLPRAERKVASNFKSALPAALKNVEKALEMFGRDTGKPVSDIVLSSNVGGLSLKMPADTGVAAWFMWDGQRRCIAVDRYPKPEDNLQAIYHVIEARRTEMRHGGLHIVRQTFRGFVALPAPDGARPWREVLGFAPNVAVSAIEIDEAFKRQAAKAHPDVGGSADEMAALNRARLEAKAAIA